MMDAYRGFAAVMAVILCGLAFEVDAAKPGPKAEGEAVYYYNGASRVELVLALDELRVVGVDRQALDQERVRAAAPGALAATAVKGAPHMSDVRLVPATGRQGLDADARRLRDSLGAKAVQAILYAPHADAKLPEQRQALQNQLAVRVRPGGDVAKLAARHNLELAEKVEYSPDTYLLVVRTDSLLAALDAANAIHETEDVVFSVPMIARQRFRRAVPNDPMYSQQWHLKNTGGNASGAVAGNDVNVEPAWNTYTGAGVNIAITDDGLETSHPDLLANARTDIDIDINNGDNDPTPASGDGDYHGTACAGVAAARGNNSVGVTGPGMAAGLVGVRLISAPTTDAQEAQALTHQLVPPQVVDRVHINSNSWGPSDDGATLEGPGPLTLAAMSNAVLNGRGGKGTIFTWAAGNGLQNSDNVNYDGYANSRYTIAVGATGAAGEQVYYSEPGAAMLVNAPSSYLSGGISTTDLMGSPGYTPTDYYSGFGGTSSACPLVAGCVSLLLQANPELTWRDVQHILVRTVTRNSPADADWVLNGAGLYFNHKFGFGRINISAAIEAAAYWSPVNSLDSPQAAGTEEIAVAIPDNDPAGTSRTMTLTAPPLFRAEHVEIIVNITHTYRGDLRIELTSPQGMKSVLAESRTDNADNYSNWMFVSVAHWSENPAGTWTLKVIDEFGGDTGTLNSWTVRVYGYTLPDTAPVVASSNLATSQITPPGSADGWSVIGTTNSDPALNTTDHDAAFGAYRVRTFTSDSKYRLAGWANNRLEWLPYHAVGTGNYVRGRFYIYAQGDPMFSQANQVPNFELRLASRYAVTANLLVYNHNNSDPGTDMFARELAPSTDPTRPSVYRLDFDPVDIPYLGTSTTGEGIMSGFDVFTLDSQDHGYLALTEHSLHVYPVSLLADGLALQTKIYAPGASDAGNLRIYNSATDLYAYNYIPSPVGTPPGTPSQVDASPPVATHSEGTFGVTLDSSSVASNRIGFIQRAFFAGASDGSPDYANRIRVDEGRIYKVRWHLSSARDTSQQSWIWLGHRAIKFAYQQTLQLGSAHATNGASNQAIALQSLPGIGCLNVDKTGGENGGWYTVLVNTPMSGDIRPEFDAATPLWTRMPNICAQPGPGVDAASVRDFKVAASLYDTLSAATGAETEAGSVTIDRIEVRVFTQVAESVP